LIVTVPSDVACKTQSRGCGEGTIRLERSAIVLLSARPAPTIQQRAEDRECTAERKRDHEHGRAVYGTILR
jgi:hypothetical protein